MKFAFWTGRILPFRARASPRPPPRIPRSAQYRGAQLAQSLRTVLLSPPLLAALERRAPPTEAEEQRLDSEEAARRAYLSRVERVLVPVGAHTPSSLAAGVVERIATSKHAEGRLFDITKFEVEEDSRPQTAPVASSARDRLGRAVALQTVEVTQQSADIADALDRVVGVSAGYDLVAIGAQRPACNGALSFGPLQDTIIHRAATDVLVVVDDHAERFDCSLARRILVPTNGLEYSMAAGDIAGALAGSCDAEVVLFHMVHTNEGEGEAERERLVASASGVIGELAFRLGRLGVRGSTKVEVASSAADAILAELEAGDYQMVVLGGVDRGADDQLYLGKTIHTVLARAEVPGVLLVSLR